ncbi:coiled-coil domain-containing protein 88B [Homo sapiens]|uniref:Coiled-coil domain-containing protein 88B n=2 Tax=Homininae TaxID=207598 RepID=CC88B_HUMAN|nr:coiled-coil domain-containing protein 88B precursor [Homo sapiens]A6NC98.1 RecName: Full=Coiled-coil domain-containing protein 88B; AltName: Full=Brain leucine zipper domain-containing protein; AltName: Full=Gipie; AltName: Full=Hook-related protein 3; Short=HkRP3 [Homo sapiens]KAI2560725.1 coiled-coil domain containing 88B [Homo sapiens]|eukprot:NP_115627.6 coiled-coil domain-containing protein 88B precursor [Homo sapiens]
MEGGKGPRLRDFLSGSLATWALGLAGLVGEAEDSEGEEEEEEEEPPLWLEKRFLRLSDGALLLRVLGIIAPSSRGGPRMLRGLDGPAAWRVWNLNHLWGRLRDFYQEELQLLILSPPPDLQTLGFDPLSEEAVEQLEGVLRLLLGASVQCEHRELFIRHIQGLSLEVQSELAAAIQEVTQPGAGVVLALSGPDPGELAPAELEMLSRSLMGTLSKLARERDLGAQRLAELLLEREPLCLRPEAPSRAPAEGPSHHLALQLANAKAQLRRLRQELEEKAELLLDSQAEVQGLEAEIRRLRQEAQALSGQAKRAELYREEAEALRERAGRLPRLQEELRRCRERLQAAEAYKSQLEEERVLSGVLEASKALLEEQLEAARERCARLHETQRENLLLRTRLGEAHAELDSLRHQVDQLAEENVELELELQRSLEPPPGSPGEAPLAGAAPSLQDEVREAEAGRLRTLERENRELRGLLQVLQGQPGGQHPLLEAPREDPVLPVLEEAPQTPVAFDHSPQGLVQKARDGGPQALDLAPPALDSVLEASAECPQAPDSDPQEAESPLQAAAMDPQASDWSPQESGSPVETQESPEKAGRRSSLQSPASVAPPQGPGTKIQAPQLLGGETEGREAPQGELVPEAWGLRQEGPEHKPGPSEPSSVQLEEQEGPNQGLDLATGQAEAREHDQRLEGTVRDPAWQKPQQKSEGALEVQVWEGPIPGESLASGVAEQEALREEVAQLRRKAEALGDELEAQARKLEAQNTEAARLSKELAQARRAEAEAHREAEAQAWEQARLREAVEAAGQELESASQEREALVEALAAAGRERRQWEREGSRLRAQSEAAEERMQVLESEGRQHLEEAERERREKEALQAELEKAVVRGKELGDRLEHLQRELEQAALERQEFLREKESQHQRYQGLEQRLEAELQAAATSKEEALMELKTRALQLEEELFQLRQGPAGLGPKKRAEPQLVETQNVRLIEVERSNAMLVAEKAALQGQLQHLEGQLGSLQGRAQELLLQSQRAQEHSSRLQAEKSVLEIQGQELHRKLEVLEEEVRAARQSQEETRGQQQALLRDHKALAQLQRRQEAELEGLLVRHRDLKANMRALELAHRELQGRHEQLQAQRASVEAQEVALLAERERLMQDGHRQRGLEEELRRLQSEHDRAQMLLAELSRERGELQGERGELRGRLARLELERAQLEMQSQQLRESNQQLDLSACRLTTQCELLTQLRSAQEEENRQLLAEVQALSRENRELLERSLESRDHLHREQREYLDQLNALRREKQKLVEKIMDQYRVLEPVPLPRTKKGSWLADKVKRLMRPRREGGPPGGLRLGADGAGSTESLGGPPETELPEGREADGTGSPSPAPMRRAQSSLCLRDETLAGGQRRKLSSRFPVGRSSESFSPGDTPRQRFRQRHPGPLGAPVSHSKGPGVGWENSAETLQEHETDANREGPEVQEPEKRPLTPSLSQ